MKKAFILHFLAITVSVLIMVISVTLSFQSINKVNGLISECYEEKELLLSAQTAHYKWGSNLSNALNYGTEFTGQKDETKCDFGKYLYSDKVKNSKDMAEFYTKAEPLHKEIHELADQVLDLEKTNKSAAIELEKNGVNVKIEQLVQLLDSAKVQKHTNTIISMVGKIAEASERQSLSVTEISRGMDQISLVVQTNSATSEESAAASEELNRQAEVMMSLISQFKLKTIANS